MSVRVLSRAGYNDMDHLQGGRSSQRRYLKSVQPSLKPEVSVLMGNYLALVMNLVRIRLGAVRSVLSLEHLILLCAKAHPSYPTYTATSRGSNMQKTL